jgi:ketosteroid isomerase-like protein
VSRENVEVVRRGHDTFNQRDLETYLSLHVPDVDFMPYERAIEGLGPYHGHDGVRQWWRETLEVLPDLKVELHELRDLGDTVLARGRLSGRGAGSGASFERTYWGLFRCRDERIAWWYPFQTEAEALEALGLRE